MAEAYPNRNNTMKCEECEAEIDVSSYNLEEYEDQFEAYLIGKVMQSSILDGGGTLISPVEGGGGVPITVACQSCEANVKIFVDVKVKSEGSDDGLESDREPRGNRYDITPINMQIRLRIICKTWMNTGYCYIGFDEDNGRLLRPILRTEVGQCCWPKSTNFKIGSSYKFKVIRGPDDPNPENLATPYPHRNQDIIVDQTAYHCDESSSWDPTSMENLARPDIRSVFGEGEIKESKYIDENTDCPSVGLLKKKEKHLSIYENLYGNKRAKVKRDDEVRDDDEVPDDDEVGDDDEVPDDDEVWDDFPLTAVSYDKPMRNGKRNALVLLGLGRPFSANETFNPKRCYILVLGIFLYE